jgi:hypothetical protein
LCRVEPLEIAKNAVDEVGGRRFVRRRPTPGCEALRAEQHAGAEPRKRNPHAHAAFHMRNAAMSSRRGMACERSPHKSLAGGRRRVVQTRRMTRVGGRRVHRAGSRPACGAIGSASVESPDTNPCHKPKLVVFIWNDQITIAIPGGGRRREPIPATSRASGAAWKRKPRNFLFESAVTR